MSAAAAALTRMPYAAAGRLAKWARQGIDSFVAVQKILLELTAQQNALAIGMVRERLSMPEFQPGDALVNVADQGISAATSAGRILLDLAAGEVDLVVDGLKGAFEMPPAVETAADVIRHRVDTFIGMQKRLLNATAEATHAAAESYKDGKGLKAGTRLAELARTSLVDFVRTEEKFLDMVAQDVTAATEAVKEGRKPPKNRAKVLTQMAREGVNQYIDAQKKLLDLAIEQFEAARKAGESLMPEDEEPRTTWAEATQKSVKNFVNAQKSLMELAIKPIKPEAGEERPRPRRPVRKRRAAKRAPVSAATTTAN
jgi:hypothetical protein